MTTLTSVWFEGFGKRRFIVGLAAVVLLLALVIGAMGPASAATLPIQSNGTLGAFHPTEYTLFDTDNGTYSVGGRLIAGGREVTVYSSVTPVVAMVYDFTSIDIPTGVTVRATGSRPLILLAQARARIDGRIDVSGQPGGYAGLNGGGGGGGGGGAVAIFADSIVVGPTGQVSAQGGAGGVSVSYIPPPPGARFGVTIPPYQAGPGGVGGPGGGTGGKGGAQIAGGEGGAGGDGGRDQNKAGVWIGAGGGGGGGGAYGGPGGKHGDGLVRGVDGQTANARQSATDCGPAPGGDGGKGGTIEGGKEGGEGGAGGTGAGGAGKQGNPGKGNTGKPDAATIPGGGGGGGGGGATLGGAGTIGGDGGDWGGGGGGGGGADNCNNQPPGVGGPGGKGGGAGAKDGGGQNITPNPGKNLAARPLSVPDPSMRLQKAGGPGGGGAIHLGAASGQVLNLGLISVQGGRTSDQEGGAGTVEVFGLLTNSGSLEGRMVQSAGRPADLWAVAGGSGGGGAGADGKTQGDPTAVTFTIRAIAVGLAGGTRSIGVPVDFATPNGVSAGRTPFGITIAVGAQIGLLVPSSGMLGTTRLQFQEWYSETDQRVLGTSPNLTGVVNETETVTAVYQAQPGSSEPTPGTGKPTPGTGVPTPGTGRPPAG